jgi:hypothetical protein
MTGLASSTRWEKCRTADRSLSAASIRSSSKPSAARSAAHPPHGRRVVRQLTEMAFPGEQIERKHEVSVRRALKNLPGVDLHLCRSSLVSVCNAARQWLAFTSWGSRSKCCFRRKQLQ